MANCEMCSQKAGFFNSTYHCLSGTDINDILLCNSCAKQFISILDMVKAKDAGNAATLAKTCLNEYPQMSDRLKEAFTEISMSGDGTEAEATGVLPRKEPAYRPGSSIAARTVQIIGFVVAGLIIFASMLIPMALGLFRREETTPVGVAIFFGGVFLGIIFGVFIYCFGAITENTFKTSENTKEIIRLLNKMLEK